MTEDKLFTQNTFKSSEISNLPTISNFDLEEELNTPTYQLKEDINIITDHYEMLRKKPYKSKEEICKDIDVLQKVTMYNLKRNNTKQNNGTLTFVCSCISKKNVRKRKNSSGVKNSERNSIMLETENSDDCEYSDLSQNSHYPSKRKIKRENKDACKFRLKFKYCKDSDTYLLKNDSVLRHNHVVDQTVTANEFSFMSRNIKFSLEIINLIIFKIYAEAVFMDVPIISEDYLKKVRDLICAKMPKEYYLNKNLKTNYNKKLSYFIKNIMNEIQTFGNYLKMTERWQVYESLYKFILKKGANYLSQYSLQILINQVEEGSLKGQQIPENLYAS